MKIEKNQEFHAHLIKQKDFLKELKKKFKKDQINKIIAFANDINSEYPEVMNELYDWLDALEGEVEIMSIGWDSDGWGAGGNGVIRFHLLFGLVLMTSSDFSDDYVEIFNKETFFPWAIENLRNDIIEIDSDIYSIEELLKIANRMGMDEHTVLTIKGTQINRP